jgi:malate dehydrogenase
MKPLKKIAITGAAGNVAYSLIFRIAHGDLFGRDVSVGLHLIDVPETQSYLRGLEMELEDCAFPLLQEIKIGSDPYLLFQNADYLLFLGARPRTAGMERKDLLLDNGPIFYEQGKILNEVASPHVRVLVAGNPCNTNCLILLHQADRIQPRSFYALSRLDQNRAVHELMKKAQVGVQDVRRLVVWGNHSPTAVIDFSNASIQGKEAAAVISDCQWLEEELPRKIQQRGMEVIRCRGKSSAASAASAIIDAFQSILTPTAPDDLYSMGVYSQSNPYGVDADLVFSFPCRTDKQGNVQIASELSWGSFLKEKITLSEKELIQERDLVRNFLP